MTFIHLHNHSEYSLLNGALRIKDLIAKAKEFHMPAVALTDYGNMFGAVDFFSEAKSKKIKPIIGCTVFLPSHDKHTERVHRRGIDHLFQLVLLIQNKEGYKNLCQLVTESYLNGFYYKPRVDTALLRQFNEGLIALSGGWSGGLNVHLFEGHKEKAKELAQTYASIFKDRFYLELQDNGVEGQRETNLELIGMAKQEGLPVIASNNCHYLTMEDSEAFETLRCVQTGATLHGMGDRLKFSTDGYYFKSPDEMIETFQHVPEAIENTVKVAELVDFEFDLKNYYFPKFDPPKGKTLDQFLEEEAFSGLKERWPDLQGQSKVTEKDRPKYEARLHEELETIKKMGFFRLLFDCF